MQAINALLPTAGADSSSPAPAANKAEQQKTQFLKLLVAQLKGQNPLNPQDGAEFVSQLAQFTSLEELINIRTILERSNNNGPHNVFDGTVRTGNE